MMNLPLPYLPHSYLSNEGSTNTVNKGVDDKRVLTRYLNGWNFDSVFPDNVQSTITLSDTKGHFVDIIREKDNNHWYNIEPNVKVGGESDAEIKRRTNFKSEEELLSFIIIVCNGDAKTMTNSCSGVLTWY